MARCGCWAAGMATPLISARSLLLAAVSSLTASTAMTPSPAAALQTPSKAAAMTTASMAQKAATPISSVATRPAVGPVLPALTPTTTPAAAVLTASWPSGLVMLILASTASRPPTASSA